MKGFLNKVQNKVAGKPADGKPATEAVAGAAIRSEATPRADISLPRGRERRFDFQMMNSPHTKIIFFCGFKFQALFFSSSTQNAGCQRTTFII
jgi:hypothetical protein